MSGPAPAGGILGEILAAKRRRLSAGEVGPRGPALLPSDGARFLAALRAPGPRVIAELKHRSPSAGTILQDPAAALPAVARAYRRAGAAALSVVVEQDFFGGDPAWLPEAKRLTGLPVLMKDFVVDEVQLDQAVALGADAVLLIVSALGDEELARLHRAARSRGLAVLVEAHDEAEVRRAVAAGAEVVGINARDLTTFAVDLDEGTRLGALLPRGAVRVAESGIRGRGDVDRLAAAGFGGFLVGESLLRAADPARALRALRGEGTVEVKVCGVTRAEDLAAAEEAGADWVGLNFSPLSPRRVTVPAARELRAKARWLKGVVAVFAGNAETDVDEVLEAVRPDAVQRHDPPPPGGARPLAVPLWQAVRVGRDDLVEAAGWAGDVLVLDGIDPEAPDRPGGTGRTWDWSVALPGGRPVFVAGGLTPDNVARAVGALAPHGVDVASGVESEPGVKDAARVAAFVAAARRGRGASGARRDRRDAGKEGDGLGG